MDKGQAPFRTANEIIAKAHETLQAPIWDYIAGASESETTKRRNRESIEEWAFRPRVLRNVSSVDVKTTLAGTPLRMPVVLAPVGSLQTIAPGGAMHMARAAEKFGSLAVISSSTQPSIEEVASAAGGDKWYQLYIRGDFDWIMETVKRIADAGYRALVLTVDAPWYSIRERQMQHGFVPPSLTGDPALEYQALLDWDMVARIRDRIALPVVLKGIQTAEDAEMAQKIGIDTLWLSNHGGRHPDHARGGMHILTEVIGRLGREHEVIVDGGFLRGTDVMKAIALGARAVAIGRMHAYALGASGGDGGIQRLLEILENEMRTGMAMIGVTTLGELDASYLERLGVPADGCNPFPLLPREIKY